MNIALRISEMSRKFPQKKSVVHGDRFYSFSEFEARSNQLAIRLVELGIRQGMRTLLFVKPSLDFSVMTFALFKIGAVPVMIDPGMGIKNLLRSIEDVNPEALISIGQVHWIRRVLRKPFRTLKIKISVDGSVGGRTKYLFKDLSPLYEAHFPIYPARDEDLSCILFTSGGTGRPKGVLYTHGILNEQTNMLQKMFELKETDIDLPGFPLFALFTLAMGMSSVIPDMDPVRPAQCDPEKLVNQLLKHNVTFGAGSPAIWERVGHYCQQHNITLPSLKSVVMFGAPVRPEIHELFLNVLPNGTTYTPYGATECLPVSLISGKELLGDKITKYWRGHGTCIGRSVPPNEIKILKISDGIKDTLDEVALGEVGEIVVFGPTVTKGYFNRKEETKLSKIKIGQQTWHRMGDLGYFDKNGYLWFCGRKNHRVEENFPIPVEAIFNAHPEVKRTALIKVTKNKKTVLGLVVERKDRSTKRSLKFIGELKMLGEKFPHTRHIEHFFLHPSFPVDVRHNIKIDREKLSVWAQGEL